MKPSFFPVSTHFKGEVTFSAANLFDSEEIEPVFFCDLLLVLSKWVFILTVVIFDSGSSSTLADYTERY